MIDKINPNWFVTLQAPASMRLPRSKAPRSGRRLDASWWPMIAASGETNGWS